MRRNGEYTVKEGKHGDLATKLEERIYFGNVGWKRLGRISPFWPIVRLTCGLHSCRTEGDFLSARVPTRGVPPIIILDRLGQGSADVTTLPHVRERDRTIKRSTRMELSSKSRMRLMGEGPP